MSEPVWVPLGASGYVPQGALVTSLPDSPVDGQEVVLTDSLTLGTFYWTLRYIAERPSHKWVFVGGGPIAANVQSLEAMTTTGAFVDLATVGPQVTIPVAGFYEVLASASVVKNATDSIVQFGLGPGAFATGQEVIQSVGHTAIAGGWTALAAMSVREFSAGYQLRMRYYQAAAGTFQAQRRNLIVRPTAIGG